VPSVASMTQLFLITLNEEKLNKHNEANRCKSLLAFRQYGKIMVVVDTVLPLRGRVKLEIKQINTLRINQQVGQLLDQRGLNKTIRYIKEMILIGIRFVLQVIRILSEKQMLKLLLKVFHHNFQMEISLLFIT
jgi:hypothetical protein